MFKHTLGQTLPNIKRIFEEKISNSQEYQERIIFKQITSDCHEYQDKKNI